MAKPQDVMLVGNDFMRSRIILTAAELDFFTHIANNPCTGEELAAKLHLALKGTIRVLDCLVGYGLLDKKGGRYFVTDAGSRYSSTHPESVLPMLMHQSQLWERWSSLTEIVRGGTPASRKPGSGMSADNRRAFIGAMHVVGRGLSVEIAEAYDLSRFKRLLDIGGASGTYTMAFLRKNPRLTAVIFDLEDVIPMSVERLSAEGFLDRVEPVAGDFYRDELPKGCDLALLSAIIHQNSREENLELYRKVFRALDPGGRLLIRDHIMDESRTSPPAGAAFAVNMLVNTSGGDTYTFREVKESLEQAGFTDVTLVRRGERMDGLVEAKKP